MARKRNIKKQRNPKGTTTPIGHRITVQPWNRQSQDITNWRNATRSAESQIPRRTYLYDLYHDISTTDAQVIAVWSKRQDAITTANWEFTDSEGNPVDAINDLIDCIGFEDLLKEIIDSKAWGYSMAEAEFFINDNDKNEFILKSVPRKNLRPETGEIVLQQHDQTGININEGYYAKTVMQFGKAKDLGLFLSAAMYAIYKRGNISDWAEFIEIFGRGIVDAEWDGFDESQRRKLAEAIQKMGGGGVIIRPAGTKVDIKNNTGTANGQLQNSFTTKMDGYISKALLGTTETTDSSTSSGYAQAETHNKQDEKKNESDLQFVRRSLNSQFIKILKAAGFDTKGGTFVIKADRNLDKSAFEIHKQMRNDLKVPIDDDFFYEEYGVRKPDNYDELKNGNIDTVTQKEEHKVVEKKDDADQAEKTETKQLSWFRRLIRLFHPAPTKAMIPMVGAVTMGCCGDPHTVTLADSTYIDINLLLLAESVRSSGGKADLYPMLFMHNANTLLSAFEQGWESDGVRLADMGFDYSFTDPKIQTAWELNLFRFSAVKAAYQSVEVNALFRKARSFDEFYRLVKHMYGVKDKNHLRTEWVTANAAGESASRYYRLLAQTKTFPYWRYMTQRDNKVRKGHEKLHGCIFRWDDPIWDRIMPPNGWNCRCYIVPMTAKEVTEEMLKRSQTIMEEYYNSDGWEIFSGSGFAVNMGNTKEVFSESQQYSKTPEKVLDNVGQMYHDDWGMDGIVERQAKAKDTYEETDDRTVIDEFWKANKVSNSRAVVKDLKGREITILRSTLYGHTSPNNPKHPDYANRHKYLSAVWDAISKPDEIWINNEVGNRFDNYIYLRYYRNIIIKVICRIDESGNLRIVSWHDAKTDGNTDSPNKKENDLYRHRRGLPIKK